MRRADAYLIALVAIILTLLLWSSSTTDPSPKQITTITIIKGE